MQRSRVNRVWATRLAAEKDITLRDIYRLYPDGNIDIAAEQAMLTTHNRLVFQHPFYWYSTPPLMKKWLDDVLTYGWAYGAGGNALVGKEWLLAISTGGPANSYQAGGYNHYSMSELLKPLQQTAQLLQTTYLPPCIFHGAVQAEDTAIGAAADALAAYVRDPMLDPQKRLAALLGEMSEAGTKL
ncbi:MAG: NAD(P)H-dependent oxidoreductase [Cardiobacteriaceae bacterium]|nr:NAD(P)H-dependent oxidoreductase [Cardiobacteriaceae bacterium]